MGRPDRYRRIVARCTVQGQDMGGWLVRRGSALDYPSYSGRSYAADKNAARTGKAGVWAGELQLALPHLLKAHLPLCQKAQNLAASVLPVRAALDHTDLFQLAHHAGNIDRGAVQSGPQV